MNNGTDGNNERDVQAENNFDDIARKNKRLKRNIIIVFVSMLAFMILCVSIPSFVDFNKLLGGEKEEHATSSGRPSTILFSRVPDDDFDIMKYEKYLGCDRYFYYYDPDTGITTTVPEGDAHKYGEGFEVIYKMINALIAGDVEAYNECMGLNVPDEDGFTQQQIYQIKITNKGRSMRYTESGKPYNQYDFIVEYKIQENNGTFRTDMGSDVIKPQYFVVADISGELCVENILNYTNIY